MKESTARRNIQQQLQKWQQGVVSVSEVKAWAEALLEADTFDTFIDDWTENEEFSAALEILRMLEMADIELLIAGDIPLLEELLVSPSLESFSRTSTEYFAKVDYLERRAALKDFQFYLTD